MRQIFTFERVRILSFVLAFMASVIPFATYINDANSGLLWLMIAANIFAYLMVALTTIRITLDIAGREKAKIAVPAKYADDAVRSKWYTAVKLSQKWHLLAVLPRFALAFASMQWLHRNSTTCTAVCCYSPEMMQAFCYASNYMGSPLPSAIYPQIETMALALLCLIILGLAEGWLLAALTLVIHRYLRAGQQVQCVMVTVARWMLLMLLLALVEITVPVYRAIIYVPYTSMQNTPVSRVYETGLTTASALMDDGMMLSAAIMRPAREGGLFAPSEVSRIVVQLHLPLWDNRPFVARQIVAGLLGLLLYALLTWGCLWLVRKQTTENLIEAQGA